MQFVVVLPDQADPKTFDQLAEAIHAAGGTVQPADQGPSPADAAEQMPGMAQEGMVPPGNGPLAAGPGAGMMPGPAMQQHGAFALRPR